MANQATPTHLINGNDTSNRVGFGELDEAIDYDISSTTGLARVYFTFELYELYHSANVHIQRKLIEARDNKKIVGSADEILVWLNTDKVTLTKDSAFNLTVDGDHWTIKPASADQRLHLLFMGGEAPDGILDGIEGSVRVDGNAGPTCQFETTAIDHLFVYGTPQFQARVYEQLALLHGYPEFEKLLSAAWQRYVSVPDIVLMQRHAGPPQQGPGFDLQRVIPASYKHLLPGDYTALLYDPYDATGLDGLTTLTRMLQEIYDLLAPIPLTPTPGQGD